MNQFILTDPTGVDRCGQVYQLQTVSDSSRDFINNKPRTMTQLFSTVGPLS